MNPSRLAELARVKRRIGEGEYDDRITPEVADAVMRDAQKPWTGRPVAPHPSATKVPLIVGPSPTIILAACCVVIPLFGYGLMCLVAWIFG